MTVASPASARTEATNAMQAAPLGAARPLEAATAEHAKAVHHDVREAVSVEVGDDRQPERPVG